MTNILVVGHSSAIAQHFCKSTREKYSIVTSSSSRSADLKIDFRENLSFDKIFNRNFTHAIIFSSSTSIKKIEHEFNEAKNITLTGPSNLINQLNIRGIRCLVLSTTAVFDENSTQNDEKSMTQPKTLYGQLKSELEHRVLTSKLNSVMRLTKVFTANSLLNKWHEDLINEKKIICFEDLKVAPLPCEFVTLALQEWIAKPYHGISHISPDQDISYYELGIKMAKQLNIDEKQVLKSIASESCIYKPRKAYLDANDSYSHIYPLDACINKVFNDLIAGKNNKT